MSIIPGHLFKEFRYFHDILKQRIFIVLGMSVFAGVLDVFGLTMFLPLLSIVLGAQSGIPGASDTVNLEFLVTYFDRFGISLTLINVIIIMMIFFSLKAIFRFLEGYFRVLNLEFFMRSNRERLISYMRDLRYESFLKLDTGRIQNTLTGEVVRVMMALQHYLVVLQQLIVLLVYVVFAIVANPAFALMLATGALLTNLIISRFYKRIKWWSAKLTGMNNEYHGFLTQEIQHFKYLKATGIIVTFTEKLFGSVREIEKSNRKMGLMFWMVQALREPLLLVVLFTVIIIEVQVLQGNVALMLLSLLFTYRALTVAMQLQLDWSNFLQVSGSLQNHKEFERELRGGKERKEAWMSHYSVADDDTDPSEQLSEIGATSETAVGMTSEDNTDPIKNDASQSELPQADAILSREFDHTAVARPVVQIQNMNLKLEGKFILKDINMEVRPNSSVAIVGASGSGKTTLVNVICGLLRPSSGTIWLKGRSMNMMHPSEFRHRFGYITQEPVIFNDTLFNNITLWDEKTEKSVQRFGHVVEQAYLRDVLSEMPNGMDSILGPNGINISGGQKQRIAIARELYRDTEILIMDEATSSLDSESEKIIQDQIERLKDSHTLLIVAHRLSTIRNADLVVLMSDGRIEATGTFDDLMIRSKTFKRMVELQDL